MFLRPSTALALPPQPKWHALAQKTSIHAANAMEAPGRPRGIFMPARVRTEWARPRKSGMVVFHWAFSLNMQNWQFSRTGFAHFGATPASDRFDRERAARGIDFDAVGKARMIENRAKIDPHSLRERDSPLLMKRRKVSCITLRLHNARQSKAHVCTAHRIEGDVQYFHVGE